MIAHKTPTVTDGNTGLTLTNLGIDKKHSRNKDSMGKGCPSYKLIEVEDGELAAIFFECLVVGFSGLELVGKVAYIYMSAGIDYLYPPFVFLPVPYNAPEPVFSFFPKVVPSVLQRRRGS